MPLVLSSLILQLILNVDCTLAVAHTMCNHIVVAVPVFLYLAVTVVGDAVTCVTQTICVSQVSGVKSDECKLC